MDANTCLLGFLHTPYTYRKGDEALCRPLSSSLCYSEQPTDPVFDSRELTRFRLENDRFIDHHVSRNGFSKNRFAIVRETDGVSCGYRDRSNLLALENPHPYTFSYSRWRASW